MNDHLGEVYNGIITGVTEWGLYVELDDNKCEGLVPMRFLDDDYYDFDEKNYTLVGRRHGNRYRLGDNVKVQVARAALDQKQLDFVIVDEKNPPRPIREFKVNEKKRSDERFITKPRKRTKSTKRQR